MNTKSQPTTIILWKLFLCLLAFYTIYYMIYSILFGIFRLEKFDGKLPFNFKHFLDLQRCCTYYSSYEIVSFMSLELTYFFNVWTFLGITRIRLWDFAVTTTLTHVLISSLVMVAWPSNWSWWICLGTGLFYMIAAGEMASYCCRKIHQNKIIPAPPQQDVPLNYLYL